jgi:hypothetical protein
VDYICSLEHHYEKGTFEYAVWHVHPDNYNMADEKAKGGKLYPCNETPVMIAVDGENNTFAALDASPSVLRIASNGASQEINVSDVGVRPRNECNMAGCSYTITGPGAVQSPDGSVWVCSLLRRDGQILRFLPGSSTPIPFEGFQINDSSDAWPRPFIHMAFSMHGGRNTMYAISSSLADNKTVFEGQPRTEEALFSLDFSPDWSAYYPDSLKVVPLRGPRPDGNALHRVVIAETLDPRSVLVTGLLTNKLFRIFDGDI